MTKMRFCSGFKAAALVGVLFEWFHPPAAVITLHGDSAWLELKAFNIDTVLLRQARWGKK